MPNATAPLWKDRKRILGLPISFTRYSIEDGRLLVRKGFFRMETDELLLYRVMDLKLARSLGQRIFGVGTVTLFSADKTDGVLALQNVKNSDKLRALLSKLIEEERAKRGLMGRELYGAAREHDWHDSDGDGFPG